MRSRLSLVALLLVAVAPLAARAQGTTRFASLDEALQAGGALAGRFGPAGLTWIEGGNRYSYTVRGASGSVIHGYDPASGQDTVLFSSDGLKFPGSDKAFNYQSFQWARDFRHLVLQTNFQPLYRRSGVSDYYVYSLVDRSLQPAASGARTAEISPDGSMLGVERGGDMYVEDLAAHTERRLTSDATPLVYNGHFDWVYEEEFGMAQGWNWSPDSRHIAYWQINESAEPVIQLSDYSGPHPEWDQIRIPQPGDSNPRARVGVLDVKTGNRVWLDPGESGEFYIPRLYWTSRPDTLAMITLDRPQQVMKLYFFDVTTGGKRLVMTETSKTWIDVYDFYAGIQDMMTFPEGSHDFFWISDRDGWQHVYRYDYSGKLINQVTHGSWSVTRIEGADAKAQTMYYTSTAVSPLERQLYSVKFDGSDPRRLTTTAGNSRHQHVAQCAILSRFMVECIDAAARRALGHRRKAAPHARGQCRGHAVGGDARVLAVATDEFHDQRQRQDRFLDDQAGPVRPEPQVPGDLRRVRRSRLPGGLQPVQRQFPATVARAAGICRGERQQPRDEQLRQRIHEGCVPESRQV